MPAWPGRGTIGGKNFVDLANTRKGPSEAIEQDPNRLVARVGVADLVPEQDQVEAGVRGRLVSWAFLNQIIARLVSP